MAYSEDMSSIGNHVLILIGGLYKAISKKVPQTLLSLDVPLRMIRENDHV